MQNLGEVRDSLVAMHNMGISLSLDDFGTGYSSLAYLRQLPVSTLKIDRSFVMEIGNGQTEGATLVRTILSLGTNLGLDMVGEGVETEEQAQFLKSHGCSKVQGFLFSKPVPLVALRDLLRAGARWDVS